MQIQPRLHPVRPQTQPKKPQIMEGFSPSETMATTVLYTAALGGAIGAAVTQDPSNLFRNVLGGAVGGSILAPAAAAENLKQRGFSDHQVEYLGKTGLYGALAGATVGAGLSLALSLVAPETAVTQVACIGLTVGGAAAGSALLSV